MKIHTKLTDFVNENNKFLLYDGIVGYCEEGGKEYVIYNPNNIEILDKIYENK